MNNLASSVPCKRKRDDDADETKHEANINSNKTESNSVQSQSNKCSVREGHSWWTCMMLDMPMSMTKPQRVDQNSTQK